MILAAESAERATAQAMFQAGLAAADPHACVRKYLHLTDAGIAIGCGDNLRSGTWRRIHLLSFGKAACAMANAATEVIPENWLAAPGIAITNYENVVAVNKIQVFGAGHPLPDQAGLQAAENLINRLKPVQAGELVLVLVSGGGSALLPCPVAGVSLADKLATTQLLLASGADINQINCVRKHLSRLKGGGLARLTATADLHALVLSDVLDDDLSVIASGPTVPDDTTFAQAIEILQAYRVWPQLPDNVKTHLRAGSRGLHAETPKSGDPIFENAGHDLIGSNALSVDAAVAAAKSSGYAAELFSKQLSGEARLVAEQLCRHAVTISRDLHQPLAIIAGGETTVTLRGTGKGGRNQELALAFAIAAETYGLHCGWTFLSAGSDGRDGPTDAAGAIVDRGSLTRIRAAAIDPTAMLNDNNAYPALDAANDLIKCGATGTNVADLQILLLHPNA
ncbi:glycerate kinase type-2 family protein [Methylomonas aurea]